MRNSEIKILECNTPTLHLRRRAFVDKGEIPVIAEDNERLPPEQGAMKKHAMHNAKRLLLDLHLDSAGGNAWEDALTIRSPDGKQLTKAEPQPISEASVYKYNGKL